MIISLSRGITNRRVRNLDLSKFNLRVQGVVDTLEVIQ